MESIGIGFGTTEAFFEREFEQLDLRDKRLNRRAILIFKQLQYSLSTCIRRLFFDHKDARQAHDFF